MCLCLSARHCLLHLGNSYFDWGDAYFQFGALADNYSRALLVASLYVEGSLYAMLRLIRRCLHCLRRARKVHPSADFVQQKTIPYMTLHDCRNPYARRMWHCRSWLHRWPSHLHRGIGLKTLERSTCVLCFVRALRASKRFLCK